jgi:hypothetical protein
VERAVDGPDREAEALRDLADSRRLASPGEITLGPRHFDPRRFYCRWLQFGCSRDKRAHGLTGAGSIEDYNHKKCLTAHKPHDYGAR